jgi:phenylalanyl-tRNA synthetase alpha chain
MRPSRSIRGTTTKAKRGWQNLGDAHHLDLRGYGLSRLKRLGLSFTLPYREKSMPDKTIVEQTLVQLGDTTADKVALRFAEVRKRFDEQVARVTPDESSWELLRVHWIGRKSGALTKIADNWLKPAPPELRQAVGLAFNDLKAHVESSLKNLHSVLVLQQDSGLNTAIQGAYTSRDAAARVATSMTAGALTALMPPAVAPFELSLPGIQRPFGTRHLIRQTYEELFRIFHSIGFSVVQGPEIESPYYNFEALNIPEHHPARDNMDTFYIEGASSQALLRTHTSPMQIRTMEKQPPPVRIVVPGKVYRRDNPDATHGYMFHQIEGLAVDTDITFCDFKGTVDYFARAFLGPKTKTRLRPSYFPFTEPSAEVDASCHVCGGSGCRICKQSGWIELFGAGMVNPAVYGFVKYDAERLSGFAFGMGVDRLAMLKYAIAELPLLFQNDVRFLRQFP